MSPQLDARKPDVNREVPLRSRQDSRPRKMGKPESWSRSFCTVTTSDLGVTAGTTMGVDGSMGEGEAVDEVDECHPFGRQFFSDWKENRLRGRSG